MSARNASKHVVGVKSRGSARGRKCNGYGCKRPVIAKGFCWMHYRRHSRNPHRPGNDTLPAGYARARKTEDWVVRLSLKTSEWLRAEAKRRKVSAYALHQSFIEDAYQAWAAVNVKDTRPKALIKSTAQFRPEVTGPALEGGRLGRDPFFAAKDLVVRRNMAGTTGVAK